MEVRFIDGRKGRRDGESSSRRSRNNEWRTGDLGKGPSRRKKRAKESHRTMPAIRRRAKEGKGKSPIIHERKKEIMSRGGGGKKRRRIRRKRSKGTQNS